MITRLAFPNETEYNKVRDIHLEILERENCLPKPDLTMWIRGEFAEEVKRRAQEQGVEYQEVESIG